MRKNIGLLVFLGGFVAGCGGGMNMGGVDGGGKDGPPPADLTQVVKPPDLIMLGATGDPCTKSSECGGNKPMCILKDNQGFTWPDGYCISACNPQKNDPSDGLNTACPGGNGTCRGSGTSGVCQTACTAMSGNNPCVRVGYECFQSCEPSARSQCNPTMKLSCPQDGGALITVPGDSDAGTDGGSYNATRTCARIGKDDVGQCADGCDPLWGQMVGMPSPPCKVTEGCYPNTGTGEGNCFVTVGGGGDGMACVYLNNCDPGLSCRTEGNNRVCRKMCGGPNKVGCPMGQSCKDISTSIKMDVLGVCGP